MPRALKSGAVITFGLVQIPVSVYKGTGEERDRLRKLCKTHLTPVEQPAFCRVNRRRLKPEQITMGYEYSKDKFVELSAAELEAPKTGDSRTIPVLASYPQGSIDTTKYFGDFYYLSPIKTSETAYRLFVAALGLEKQILQVRVVLSQKTRPAFITVEDGLLVLYLMRNPTSFVDPRQFAVPSREIDRGHLTVARELVRMLKAEFSPEALEKEFKELEGWRRELIERKLEGLPPFTRISSGPVYSGDLMAALKQSVAEVQKKKGAPSEAKAS